MLALSETFHKISNNFLQVSLKTSHQLRTSQKLDTSSEALRARRTLSRLSSPFALGAPVFPNCTNFPPHLPHSERRLSSLLGSYSPPTRDKRPGSGRCPNPRERLPSRKRRSDGLRKVAASRRPRYGKQTAHRARRPGFRWGWDSGAGDATRGHKSQVKNLLSCKSNFASEGVSGVGFGREGCRLK